MLSEQSWSLESDKLRIDAARLTDVIKIFS